MSLSKEQIDKDNVVKLRELYLEFGIEGLNKSLTTLQHDIRFSVDDISYIMDTTKKEIKELRKSAILKIKELINIDLSEYIDK